MCIIVADNPIEIESDGEVENDSDDDDNDGNDGSDDHNDPIEIESDIEVENDSDDNDNDGNDGSDDHNDDRITNIVDYLDIVINMLRDLKEMLRRMQHN